MPEPLHRAFPAVLVVLVACSGAVSGPVTPAQACADLAKAICNQLDACEPNVVLTRYGDAAACVSRTQTTCPSLLAARGSGVTPDPVETCARAYGSLRCEDLLLGHLPADCAFHGSLPSGSGCAFDAQCAAPNDHCAIASGVCGVCGARSGAGATCRVDGDCQPGLVCAVQVAPVGGNPPSLCLAPAGLGEMCDLGHPCLATLACVLFACQPRAGAGAACQLLSQNCDVVHGFVCGAAGTCDKARTTAAGGDCGQSLIDQSFTECTRGATCNTHGTAVFGTCDAPAADGAMCDSQSGPFCVSPAVCLNGVCTLPDPVACP
jgi:hypothetical protein